MNPDPSANVLVYVLWSLVGLVVTMGGALVWVIKIKKEEKPLKTFAEDPDRYWERMRQVVTEPLARVLDNQTAALQELMKEIIRIDERSKFRSSTPNQ